MFAILFLIFSYLSLCYTNTENFNNLHPKWSPHSWHLPLLGKPSHSYFVSSNSSNTDELIVFSSVLNVIGVVNATSSALKWRHILPRNENYATSTVCDTTMITLTNSEAFGSFLKLWSVRTGSLLSVYPIYRQHNFTKVPNLFCISESRFGITNENAIYQFGISEKPSVWFEVTYPIIDSKFDGRELWVLSRHDDSIYVSRLASGSLPVTKLVYKAQSTNTYTQLVLAKDSSKYVIAQSDSKLTLLSISKDLSSTEIPISIPLKGSSQFSVFLRSSYLQVDINATSTIFNLQSLSPIQIYHGQKVISISPVSNSLYLLFQKHIAKISNVRHPSIEILDQSVTKDFDYHSFTVSEQSEKILGATAEGHVELWDNDKKLWTRFESLASPRKAFVLDYPSEHMWEEEEELVTNVFKRWFDRWSLHWHQLRRLEFLNLSPSHSFDFSKLIIVWTDQNFLYAIESSQGGAVKWWKKLPSDIHTIHLVHPTKGSDPALFVLQGSEQDIYLSPFSGELFSEPQEDLEKNFKKRPHLTSQHTTSFYTYNLNSNGTLTGFFKKYSSNTTTQLYTLKFDEPILKTSKINMFQRIASQGRIMFADRSVQYKYLNPHQLAILTGLENTLKLHFIDVVTGHILFTFQTVDADLSLPVHLISVENWTVLLYWGVKSGWTATVIDLYETHKPLGAFSSFTAGTPVNSISSFVLPIRDIITGIAVTSTRNNIAIRDLLYTTDRSIGCISRKLVDGLRSISYPPENDILPYEPVLALDDLQVLSKGDVIKTNLIISHPSELESTSMVFAYGHDLFWTSVTPSGSFDKLSSHFPKLGLIATFLGLFTSVLISRRMLRRKQLNIQWH